MTIIISKKLKTYIKKKEISQLLITVSFFTEGCILIKEPKIIDVTHENKRNFYDSEKNLDGSLILHFSKEFYEIFNKNDEYHLDLGSTFRKKVILTNIQPKIIRTCKVDN